MRILLAAVLAVLAAAPVTGEATDVTATSAMLHGTVAPGDTYVFEWGTADDYGSATAPAVAEAAEVEARITGLTVDTTYHFTIRVGDETGGDQTFTTRNPQPPGVSEQRARDLGPTTATLTADVDPNGNSTEYVFELGTSLRYGRSVGPAEAGNGSDPVTVTAAVGDLRPNTRYHWRTVATNVAGTTRGRDRTFTTARLPTGVSLGVSRRVVPFGGETALGGRVSGTGVGGMTVALQQQRFPYDEDFTVVATSRTGGDGGYLFEIDPLWTTTNYRVVTRAPVVVSSRVATIRSAVRPGLRVRHVSRTRAMVFGSALPAVAGTALLQRRIPGRGWRPVQLLPIAPSDAIRSRYTFIVRRPRHGAPKRRYRVLVTPDKGAYVSRKSRSVKVRPRP